MQRVTSASVSVDGEAVGTIGAGLLLLVAVGAEDDIAVARRVAAKCSELRVFADARGRFDGSLLDTGGGALVVSQFTLLADTRKGRRPSFAAAAPPAHAAPIIDAFAHELRARGVPVETGRFGASMQVESINDGPVTIIIDSADLDRPRQ